MTDARSPSYTYREWTGEDACSANYIDAAVLKALGPTVGRRVLDIGCGNGHFAELLVARGADVTGIDLSETGLEACRRRVAAARFERLPADATVLEALGCDPFDLVVSTEVVEHLYSPASFAAGAFAALRPGGRLVLTTPHHGWLKNVVLAASGSFDKHVNPLFEGGHIKFFSINTMRLLLEKQGFERIEFGGAGRVRFLWKSMVVTAFRPT